MEDLKSFSVQMWYDEDEYGKAFCTVEAASEEAARKIVQDALDDNQEMELDWDFYAKGGCGIAFNDTTMEVFEDKVPE
jgi:hypothetical protein